MSKRSANEANGLDHSALISTFGATAAVTVLSLAASVLIARGLGPDGRGVLLALTFWPTVLAAVFSLSINESTAYHVARASMFERGSGSRNYAATSLLLQAGMALAATALSLSVLQIFLPESRRASLALVLMFAAAFTPMTILDQHFKAVMQGRGAFRALSVARVGQIAVYSATILVSVVSGRLTVEIGMCAMLVALAVSLFIGAVATGVQIERIDVGAAREIVATGAKFHIANLLLWAAAEVDKLIVILSMDDTKVGYYSVAIGLSAVGGAVVVQSLGIVVSREMSSAPDSDARKTIFLRSILLAGFLVAPVSGGAIALAGWWMPLLYGREFTPAVPVAMILLAMGAVKAIRQTMDRAMRAAHVSSVGMIGEGVALAGFGTFALIGVKLAGLEGLAWGMVSAQICSLLVMFYFSLRALRVSRSSILPIWRDQLGRFAEIARATLSRGGHE